MMPLKFPVVVATLAIVVASASAIDEAVFSQILLPSRPNNPRNSEAAILPLQNRNLLLAWNEFYTKTGSDWGNSRISSMVSDDGGKTWGQKHVLQENIGQMNVMEPNLLRLRSGKVLFVFARKNSEADCQAMVRISNDDARTFSAPVPLPTDPIPAYWTINNDRLIQLRSGRILLPMNYTRDYRLSQRFLARVYYSDNDGATWTGSRSRVDVKASKVGSDEPGVVELSDGRVMLWLRTDTGHPYRCYSSDGGVTWSEPEPMTVTSPNSPQSIKRIPGRSDLLMVWNNSATQRSPLTTAISKNGGNTWDHVRNLDEDGKHTFAYTSITFFGDRALFTYYFAGPGLSLKFASTPISELYR